MPQDAITLAKTSKLLNELLKGAKVNKVTQPTADEVILNLYCKNGSFKLNICANAVGARVGLTSLEKKNPSTPSGFCMLLRKHLLSATLVSVTSLDLERIVCLTFDGKNDFLEPVQKQLYCEVMGKYSNIIFCENQIILGTLKSSALELGKERALLSGAKYALPKSQGKTNIYDKEASLAVLNQFSSGDLSNYIFSSFQGVSLPTAKEIVYRFFGEEIFIMPIVKTAEFYDFILDFINNSNNNSNVVISQDKLVDFYFCDYKTVTGNKVFFKNLLEAEQYYFDNKQTQREFNELKNKLTSVVNSKLKKEIKKLQIISEKELACSNAEDDRRRGELITANIYKIKKGDKFVIVDDYYNENAPLKIALDEQLSANANAQKYFKKYQKLKNTLKAIIPQKEQCENECTYYKSVLSELNIAQTIKDLYEIEEELKQSGLIKNDSPIKGSKKEEKISYRVFDYNGYKILAGKNNIQNDKLTFSAKPSDIWLHTKEYHSAHVIIQSSSLHVPNEILQIAAEICAYYSEAKNGDKVPVDYTQRKYVKKPPKSKYGAVIYTDFKTVFVTPNSHSNLEI